VPWQIFLLADGASLDSRVLWEGSSLVPFRFLLVELVLVAALCIDYDPASMFCFAASVFLSLREVRLQCFGGCLLFFGSSDAVIGFPIVSSAAFGVPISAWKDSFV
ncbi:hypothetical protein U1Q18_043016, partial [Sarracenia purpurea var. burkii]